MMDIVDRPIRGKGSGLPSCRDVACVVVAVAATLGATTAMAQAWPTRAIRLVVPYAPGGASDVVARQVAARLQAAWGQPVVVENKAGASGNIGSLEVVRAPADGYTLLLQNVTMVINQAVTGKRAYEPLRDLTPIVLMGATPMALVANPGTGVSNVKELVAKAKTQKAADLNYGSCGIGTPQHLVMEILKGRTGLKLEHVAYKGCSPAVTDVLGGQIPYGVFSANAVVPYVKAGKLRALGVSTSTRYPGLPDTPTFEEQGIKPFDFASWYTLMGPAKLPADIVARVQGEVQRSLADPEVRKALSDAGIEEKPGDAKAVVQLITTEQARYQQVVKDADIKPE